MMVLLFVALAYGAVMLGVLVDVSPPGLLRYAVFALSFTMIMSFKVDLPGGARWALIAFLVAGMLLSRKVRQLRADTSRRCDKQ